MKNRINTQVLLLLFLTVTLALPLAGEDITLQQCEDQTAIHYPLAKQAQLISIMEAADAANAQAQYLPHVNVAAKASRQSDATSVSIPGGLTLNGNLNQYQVVGEVNQLVFDGGAVSAQKKGALAASAVAQSKLAVSLEAVKRAVRETYFTVLFLESQQEQVTLMQQELSDTHAKLEAYRENGLVTQSDVDAITIEKLTVQSQLQDLQMKWANALYALSQMTGLKLGNDTHLVTPQIPILSEENLSAGRKEYALYQAQLDAVDAQKQALDSSLYPKLSVFAQVGYSQPGLNMLNTDPSFWWIAGVKGSFSLDPYYTYAANKEKLDASKQQVLVQQEQFNLDEGIKLRQKRNEIEALQQQLAIDDQIIALKRSIKDADEAKIANGARSVSDLIQELQEVALAEITKAHHEVQLLLAQSELNLIIGKGDIQK
ncbi:TolC family protein [Sphaerochaeta sp.]|uniref:TolC family protein n=1 Tax=Sphaerochaeta sp. TaxID=1972642 RepID=UPI002FC605D4